MANVSFCASAITVSRDTAKFECQTLQQRVASANGCSRDCRAGSLCYSLSADLDSFCLYTLLLHDVVRANDAGQVDVTAFISTGCKTIFEKPRYYIHLCRHKTWLWVQRARERFVALVLTAKNPLQMCMRIVQKCVICMPSIPYIFIIARINAT